MIKVKIQNSYFEINKDVLFEKCLIKKILDYPEMMQENDFNFHDNDENIFSKIMMPLLYGNLNEDILDKYMCELLNKEKIDTYQDLILIEKELRNIEKELLFFGFSNNYLPDDNITPFDSYMNNFRGLLYQINKKILVIKNNKLGRTHGSRKNYLCFSDYDDKFRYIENKNIYDEENKKEKNLIFDIDNNMHKNIYKTLDIIDDYISNFTNFKTNYHYDFLVNRIDFPYSDNYYILSNLNYDTRDTKYIKDFKEKIHKFKKHIDGFKKNICKVKEHLLECVDCNYLSDDIINDMYVSKSLDSVSNRVIDDIIENAIDVVDFEYDNKIVFIYEFVSLDIKYK